ncbi:MAG: DUF1553 domain-containing protein [Pirellulales bacterium]
MPRIRRPCDSRKIRLSFLGVLLLACSHLLLKAQESPPPSVPSAASQQASQSPTAPQPADRVNFRRDLQPLFRERCYACHGGLKQEAGLRLDTTAALRRGGTSGPGVVPGDPAASLLIRRLTATEADTRMPPDGPPLTPEQLARIQRWITQGATGDAGEQAEADPRDHWAFQPPVRPAGPTRHDPAGALSPLDAFVHARLAAEGLRARPAADRATLLRRVYLDLIGLPPTREELLAFLADPAPDAYQRIVDRLLADPRHGERWARHWMDIWRYSDWYGRRHVPDVWNSAPQIWRWRDWIVDSLNHDHGYDRLVQEMLAADEIAPTDPSAAVATGFLIRNWYALNPNDWMRANVEHTSKAFLGLTWHCAHCHDHKYDPLTQADYFRFRAFFEPIGIRQDRVPGQADPGLFQEYSYSVLRKIQRLGTVSIYDKTPAAPTWFYTGGDERNRLAERGSQPPTVPEFLGAHGVAITPVDLPAVAWYPGLRPDIQETLRQEHRTAMAALASQETAAQSAAAAALPALREQLATASAALTTARQKAVERTGPLLRGQQALVLDATQGRRVVQHGLSELKEFPSGTRLSFLLRIVHDAHVNFQLAKDVVQGLTASCVAFDRGRIVAYQPGTYQEFPVGQYEAAAGQLTFAVELEIDRSANRCLLTVRALPQDRLLVDRTPIALHGWNPVGDPRQAISFDARTGSVAAIDEVCVTGPAAEGASGERWLVFDFEPPRFSPQADLVGQAGWQGSSFSQAPATSLIQSALADPGVQEAERALHLAQRAVAAQELQVQALAARRVAAEADLVSLEARIAADQARYQVPPASSTAALIQAASLREREAACRRAEAEVLVRDQALAGIEIKPASDPKRAGELTAAQQQLATARTAAEQARRTLTDASLAERYSPLTPTYPTTSTGRRRALALWITRRDHPLTARVAVNHVWLRHFHAPLVASVFDFGRNGARPTHPELLDWLAVELGESGWSLKQLHRTLVTSATYGRTSAVGDPAVYASDPENRWLWRMNVGRLEAEAVRDSLLYVAGRLDLTRGGQELENSQALTTFRRTLYYSCHPELDGKSEFGALFDAPEPTDCYRRTRSVVPQQALALANSPLVHELSRLLADDLQQQLTGREQDRAAEFVLLAGERILGRRPTAEEWQACLTFLGPTPDARSREALVRVLFNHNDFLAIR